MRDTESVVVDIEIEGVIRYAALDPTPGGGKLGRAEFVLCPVWKRGHMAELLIYRRQQPVEPKAYRLVLPKECGRITTFSFQGGGFHDRYPDCWRMWWCKEHKTVSYEVYVPSNTDTLTFEPHFGDSLDIRFAKAEGR